MTYASLLAIVAGPPVRFAFYTSRRRLLQQQRRQRRLLIPLIMLASAVGCDQLPGRLLSRYRELAADRSGARPPRNPAPTSALTKVSQGINRIPTRTSGAAESLNAFYFAPAMPQRQVAGEVLSTHPSLEKRIEQRPRSSVSLARSTRVRGLR